MRVGVVGLGFAGLRTARLLESAGVEVELFEARTRPGGRMHSVDDGQGLIYEAGGEWIDADHHRMLRLMREHGMEPDPRSPWPQKLIFKGKRTSEHLVWSDALEDDLRVEAVARDLCRGLRTPPWENPEAEELDHKRLDDFLREHTNSERGLWWVTAKYRSDEGDDLDRIGVLGWLSGFMFYLNREGHEMSSHRIPGGSGKLAEKMVAALRATPNYNAVLQRVRQTGKGVELVFENGSSDVDLAVLTLPPRCLERVVFEPALSVRKRCAIEACESSRAVKLAWQFETAWWKDQEWGGSMLCDGPLQQTWDGSLGESPVLMGYVGGTDAEHWSSRPDPVQAGLEELIRLFPDAAKGFVQGWFHDWQRDPYSRGAFSHLAPGYVTEHMKYIAPDEDCVYFAGEHTSLQTGFVEGALASAERVASEVLSNVTR